MPIECFHSGTLATCGVDVCSGQYLFDSRKEYLSVYLRTHDRNTLLTFPLLDLLVNVAKVFTRLGCSVRDFGGLQINDVTCRSKLPGSRILQIGSTRKGGFYVLP